MPSLRSGAKWEQIQVVMRSLAAVKDGYGSI